MISLPIVRVSINPNFAQCEAGPSEAETVLSDVEVDWYRIVGGISGDTDSPVYGSLCHELPNLDNFGRVDSNLANIFLMQAESDIGLTTPPSVNSQNLSAQTPESILKMAARTFRSTPSSIIRKREPERRPEERVLLNSSGNTELQNNSSRADTIMDNKTGPFNSSPPYRLNFKRNSVLKLVEKQLDFASNTDQECCDNNTKAGDVEVKKKPPVTKFYTRQRRGSIAGCLGLQCPPSNDWYCPHCRDKFGPGRKAAGESRPLIIRLKRIVKAPEFEPGGCVICRSQDFSAAKFDDRTVIICDQCEKEYHVGCLRESGLCDLKELPEDNWFCCDDCNKIFEALQNLACSAPEECFDPIVAKSGQDLIPVMVYGRNISGQEFIGMYCVVLLVKSVVVSAALLRIFGKDVTELPLVATEY